MSLWDDIMRDQEAVGQRALHQQAQQQAGQLGRPVSPEEIGASDARLMPRMGEVEAAAGFQDYLHSNEAQEVTRRMTEGVISRQQQAQARNQLAADRQREAELRGYSETILHMINNGDIRPSIGDATRRELTQLEMITGVPLMSRLRDLEAAQASRAHPMDSLLEGAPPSLNWDITVNEDLRVGDPVGGYQFANPRFLGQSYNLDDEQEEMEPGANYAEPERGAQQLNYGTQMTEDVARNVQEMANGLDDIMEGSAGPGTVPAVLSDADTAALRTLAQAASGEALVALFRESARSYVLEIRAVIIDWISAAGVEYVEDRFDEDHVLELLEAIYDTVKTAEEFTPQAQRHHRSIEMD